jgi:hypothetical protein
MQTAGLRTYRITVAELPLRIEVTAIKLPANRSIIGNLRVSKNGVLQERIPVQVVEERDALKNRFEIVQPAVVRTPFDLTQTIECWFKDNASADARYQIQITSTNGDEVTTAVRRPTIDPGVANLAFQVQ